MASLSDCKGVATVAECASAEFVCGCATRDACERSGAEREVARKIAFLLSLSKDMRIIISVADWISEEMTGETSVGEGAAGVALEVGTEGDDVHELWSAKLAASYISERRYGSSG